MEVYTSDVDKIPRTNLRVPRDEFVAVWRAAEAISAPGGGGWFVAGVGVTCRWLACATVRPPGRQWYVARAPVSGRTDSAYEELIEAEYLAAEKLAMRPPEWMLARRPGWVDGVLVTFRWAWCRTAPPPLPIPPVQEQVPRRVIG